MKVIGVHAFILDVEIPEFLQELTHRWLQEGNGNRVSALTKTHLTLLFVGRDLDPTVGATMVDIAVKLKEHIHIPTELELTGALEMFGYYYDHLVAIVKKNDYLSFLRDCLSTELLVRIPTLKKVTSFSFTPHVTLGKGSHRDIAPRISIFGQKLIVKNLVIKMGSLYHQC